ncbi:LysR family transcriptional regulator [Paraburkholderia rhynchosiae]|uniref:HTH-type transcriptional regulator DmlR n=1 Tax=Paraburkholderia rhynchosiae TaxID=487049 RepID=A0A2N7WK07_9BURK|nr:LysR family transcriptional regulator [Paraburkholderia rhynchosiae]PMS29747.1 LysR family transcriptional regulator [Paraburkholderia rhynchosiae]CAB3698541.1 HTH-type transcriptional regulator DmlR [Paraburkholderia rhynchosiae]
MDMQKVEGLWVHLHWLSVLAEQGSYTAAAARLGVSKAAMSQRIAELERAAGIALVQRTTRSMRFTEAGQRLVETTRAQYDQIATSFSAVQEMAGVVRGLIRVTAPVAFGRQQLVPRMPLFLQANRQVKVQLDLSDQLSSIATEGFDLAIRHSAQIPETHVAWKLCETRSVIIATRAYLKRQGRPAEPADLASHDCLFYPRASGSGIWTFEQKSGRKAQAGPVSVTVNGPFAANNSESLRDAALDDLGIALVPDFTAQQAVHSGKLEVVLPDWRPMGAFAEQLYVVRPYAPHVPRAVALFIAHLRETFAEGFPLQRP